MSQTMFEWLWVTGTMGVVLVVGLLLRKKVEAEVVKEERAFQKTFWDNVTVPSKTTQEDTKDYWDEESAKDMPIEDFNEIFEGRKTIIEKETYGYTTSLSGWLGSDARFAVPKHGTQCFEALYMVKSYATAESFMLDGKVYAMDVRKPVMFTSLVEMQEYAKTLFAVFIAYVGISPIDRTTQRYFIVGCKEEDGVVPTHGL